MSTPQTAFVDILIAVMRDAAIEKKLTQIKTQLDPTGTGKGPMKQVRIIVIPEEMDYSWPEYAPLGTGKDT